MCSVVLCVRFAWQVNNLLHREKVRTNINNTSSSSGQLPSACTYNPSSGPSEDTEAAFMCM